MAPTTRSRKSAPANRVYTSSMPQQQVHFKPRRRRVNYRHSTGSSKPTRQQTLTQIDFVNLQRSFDTDEEEDEEEVGHGIYEDQESKRERKRRKTTGDLPSSSARHYTQTLTQLDFVSTPATRVTDEEDDLNDDEYVTTDILQSTAERDGSDDELIITESPILGSSDGTLCKPSTPISKRVLEIPSSQSPATPLSVQSRTSLNDRSPLKDKSPNVRVRRLLADVSPQKPTSIRKLEIKDSYSTNGENGSLVQEPSPPVKKSSPQKSVRFAPVVRSPTPSQHAIRPNSKVIEDSDAETEEEPDTCYDDFSAETQAAIVNLVSSSEQMTEGSSSLADTGPSDPVSQYRPSQRLSTQDFDAMAPRSSQSDIIISIHPKHVQNIVTRAKDHEFRSWPIPEQVTRIWIYETSPTSALKYMAIISSAKRPGEITNLNGIGNKEFNDGKGLSVYAYEIFQLFELANPVSLASLKANHWLAGPPQKFIYVRPAVLNSLMANLKPAILSSNSTKSTESTAQLSFSSQKSLTASFQSTDSQKAEAQLLSNMVQFSQAPLASSLIGSSDTKSNQEFDLLSTQQDSCRDTATATAPTPTTQHELPRPSQASTVDLSQPRSPPLARTPAEKLTPGVMIADSDDESEDDLSDLEQFNNPQPPSSSPPLLPPPPAFPTSSPELPLHARPRQSRARLERVISDDAGNQELSQEPGTAMVTLPLSLSSSQLLLTRSQMLPESLMDDESVPAPPPVLSDDEDDE